MDSHSPVNKDEMETAGKTILSRAVVCWEPKKPTYTVETIEVHVPKAREVRIKVVAAGLCHTDVHATIGEMATRWPFVLGHEGAGIVESVGPDVADIKPGDKVLTLSVPNCGSCYNCKLEDRTCRNFLRMEDKVMLRLCTMTDDTPRFSYKGQPLYHFGGTSCYSEYTVCEDMSVVKIHDDAPLDKIFPYSCAVPTGYGAVVHTAKVHKGATVAIWGLGAVGLSSVIAAKDVGAARIIGIDINQNKCEIAMKLGCTDFINPLTLSKDIETILMEMTATNLDYAFVCVGDQTVIETAVRSVSLPGGTVCVVGICPKMVSVNAEAFLGGLRIIGCSLGGGQLRKEIPKLVDKYVEGKLNTDVLITHTFNLEELENAMAISHDPNYMRGVFKFC